MPFTRVGMHNQKVSGISRLVFVSLKKAHLMPKLLILLDFHVKKYQRGKKCIGNYIIGQRKANYFSLMKIFFSRVTWFVAVFDHSPQNVLAFACATPCACSRRIKLYNYCPNHFSVHQVLYFSLSVCEVQEISSTIWSGEQEILMCLEVMS